MSSFPALILFLSFYRALPSSTSLKVCLFLLELIFLRGATGRSFYLLLDFFDAFGILLVVNLFLSSYQDEILDLR